MCSSIDLYDYILYKMKEILDTGNINKKEAGIILNYWYKNRLVYKPNNNFLSNGTEIKFKPLFCNASGKGNWKKVQNKTKINKTVEVKSKTGRIDENKYLV